MELVERRIADVQPREKASEVFPYDHRDPIAIGAVINCCAISGFISVYGPVP